MKKRRSTYSMQFNTDPNNINQLIQKYLTVEKFKIHEKNGEQFFKSGDQWEGFRGFKYSIEGQTLTVEAWIIGMMRDFPLEYNSMNIMMMNYRNSLNNLFQEISKLNTNYDINNQQQFATQTEQTIQHNNQNNNINQFAQNFQNENIKKQENLCEIGFWMSILGLLCSLGGVTFGVLLYIVDFYFASQGMNTRKKGKATATIILSIISIIITVLQLF